MPFMIFRNCLIASNHTGTVGSAVYCDQSAPEFFNCTFSSNTSVNGGAVYCQNHSAPIFTNCIFWNLGEEFMCDSSSHPAVKFSCVQGGWSGEGNTSFSPEFVDIGGGDYHLQDGSSCIDSGSPEIAPSIDLDGNPRPGLDGFVDMGAYETPSDYEPGFVDPLPLRYYVNASAPQGGDGLSWSTAFNRINQALEVAASVGYVNNLEIWIAQGVYLEAIQLEPTMRIYGGFSGTEVSPVQRETSGHATVIDASGTD